MSLLIADAKLGVWKAADGGAPLSEVPCPLEQPHLVCAGSALTCPARWSSPIWFVPAARWPAWPGGGNVCA